MNEAKSILVSKTFWLNATALVAGLADYFTTGNTTGLVAAIMGVINVALRLVTTKPVTVP